MVMTSTVVEPGLKPGWRAGVAALAVFVALVLVVSAVAGLASQPSADPWYRSLALPSFQPPSWAFGVVWPLLYLMMAVAAWRIWYVAGGVGGARLPLALWGLQLAVNFAWTFLFFAAHSILGALIDIVALWLLIVATTVVFFRRDRWAGFLMLPYIAWVSFAVALNYRILALNPGA